jgi:rod shape-determining protein MreB
MGLFSKDLGIDLGTANTVVVVRGEGIVLREPSVVAVIKGTNQVLSGGRAVGEEAKRMLGKTPADIEAIRPLREGVISDARVAEAMISYFIAKAHGRSWGIRPRLLIAVPSGITAVEKEAVFIAAHRAGARKVFLVEEPRAAAVGAGLRIEEPRAKMIVDMGGGTTEIAILTCASIETSHSIRVSGDAMDEAIINHMRRNYNLLIGEQTAERVKIEVGSVVPLEQERETKVRGRSGSTGLPEEVTVSSEEIRQALLEPATKIVEAIRSVLERTKPELSADLVETGITLAGGTSLLRGMDKLVENETGLATRIAENPMDCVARGCHTFLENLELFSSILTDDQH